MQKIQLFKKNAGYDRELNQITFFDSRFYQIDETTYYPSVTHILGYYPKGIFFEQWLKDVGPNADIIAEKAADDGKQVHDLIERYLSGEKISWLIQGRATYSKEVWGMFCKFRNFWLTIKPELIASEVRIFSRIHKYAGTIDLILMIEGKLWLIDIKTSNYLHTSYELQTAAYATAFNEAFTDQYIEKTGILWLKAVTRGADKSGKKIQGEGWKLHEYDRSIDKSFELFNHVYAIFREENPDFTPHHKTYPSDISLEQDLQ